jgi:uncharacterized membrane protein
LLSARKDPLLRPVHPLQAIFVAGALTLFVGVFCSDLTYARSHEVQWKNFASWLLVGGLALEFVALTWAIVDFIRLPLDRGVRRVVYVAALLVSWVLGFVNALVHAGDAWASMPTGLVISAIVAILAVITAWLAFANHAARAPTRVSA